MHLLVGDSSINGVYLGHDIDGLNEWRCLPGATFNRDKRCIANIVKAASKESKVDLFVHSGTIDFFQKYFLSKESEF